MPGCSPRCSARPLPRVDATGLRVGVVRTLFEAAQVDVAAACEAALESAGWAAHDVTVDHLELAGAAGSVRLMSEAGSPPPALLAALSPATRRVMLAAMLLPASAVPRADRVRAAVRHAVAGLLGEVDLLAWPAAPAPAPPLADLTVELPAGRLPADLANVRFAVLANVCGVPAISVPVGFDPRSGMPIGLQLVAPWGGEQRLLDAAAHLEEATGRAHVDLIPPLAR